MPEPTGKIKLENISFTYPNTSKPIVKNINLNIESNTTVGLVGATGSGKTTLVDIVLGLLEPSGGKLFLDDVELSSTNISSWQSNIGYVPQDIYIVDDTIEHNIAFGEDNIDIDKVKQASIMSEIHEFILSLPDGYKTIVGERGVRLSGGQRQRIGIARALYHSPKVIVFDEATSSLDGETESNIINAIATLSGKKTILMIAHRLSTLRDCDMIYFLEKGKIVNFGNYSKLLESDENFKKMANIS